MAKLAPYPMAVDVLLHSLKKPLEQPSVEKFRMVNLSNPHFKKAVGNIPGGTELLYAVGYEPLHGHLVLQKVDQLKLELACKGLEKLQSGKPYMDAKKLIMAEQARVQAEAQAAEEARRRECLPSCMIFQTSELLNLQVTCWIAWQAGPPFLHWYLRSPMLAMHLRHRAQLSLSSHRQAQSLPVASSTPSFIPFVTSLTLSSRLMRPQRGRSAWRT